VAGCNGRIADAIPGDLGTPYLSLCNLTFSWRAGEPSESALHQKDFPLMTCRRIMRVLRTRKNVLRL